MNEDLYNTPKLYILPYEHMIRIYYEAMRMDDTTGHSCKLHPVKGNMASRQISLT